MHIGGASLTKPDDPLSVRLDFLCKSHVVTVSTHNDNRADVTKSATVLDGKFLAFNENGSATSGENPDYSDSEGIWEEKDVADLLQDLKHFDQKNK